MFKYNELKYVRRIVNQTITDTVDRNKGKLHNFKNIIIHYNFTILRFLTRPVCLQQHLKA